MGTKKSSLGALRAAVVCALAASVMATVPHAARADALLDEAVEFTGQVLYLEHKVPALVISHTGLGKTQVVEMFCNRNRLGYRNIRNHH